MQGEVNTARQRIQAAEKARLELEVGFAGLGLVLYLPLPLPLCTSLSTIWN